jgi:hypothetical protein
VLAVIATEIAVLAASSASSDQAAAQAIERALGDQVMHPHAVTAVRTDSFASLAEARKLVALARKQDLEVDFGAALGSLNQAVTIFEKSVSREELADALIHRGVVLIHAKGDPREDFCRAKFIDPKRQLTRFEVHPQIADAYASTGCPIIDFLPGKENHPTYAPDEICDVYWCDDVIIVGVSERNGRASLVGSRYDANARAFTERAVAGNARELIDTLTRSPAFAHEQPSLVLPPEPPPPKIWQRTWFWTAVGGAAAAALGSLIYADATRDVHTNVSVPAGVFGGR